MIPFLDTHKLVICRATERPAQADLRRRTRNAALYGLRHAGRVAIVNIQPRGSARSLIVTRVDDPIVTAQTCVITLASPVAEDAWNAVHDVVAGEIRAREASQ